MENPKEAARAVRQMAQEAGYRILLGHLHKHLRHKELEKSRALRENQIDKALALQGRIDGIEWVIEEVVHLSTVKESKDNPSY